MTTRDLPGPAASGLEGIVAFDTEIAEPDRDGGALRYRGIDLDELTGIIPFEHVWGLLVDDDLDGGLDPLAGDEAPPRLDPAPDDVRVELQAALAALAPAWGLPPTLDVAASEVREQLARASLATLDIVARAAAPAGRPAFVADRPVSTLAERFLARATGNVDPIAARALDAYWTSAAEHGMNASTFTARVIASTGADIGAALSGAVGALSGPLHGGAPARVLAMLDEVERDGDADRWVGAALDRGERLMGFGHRIYRAEDPRARALRRVARELGCARIEVAERLEASALAELYARRPDRVLATNVEFWSAVVLDRAGIPPALFTAVFACARVAGWSAHILEQRRTGRLVRPTARYVGRPPRTGASALRGPRS
jgi:citrate synthase